MLNEAHRALPLGRYHEDFQSFFRLYPARRIIDLPPSTLVKDYNTLFFNVGSCFATNIDFFLSSIGMPCCSVDGINTNFSSESIATLLGVLSGSVDCGDENIYDYDDAIGGHNPYLYHFPNRFFGDKIDTLRYVQKLNAKAIELIKKCSHMVITLGTSNVIRSKQTGLVVNAANKMKEEYYYRHRNDVEQERAWQKKIIQEIRTIRGGDIPTIIFTLSPQRYNFSRPEGNKVDGFDSAKSSIVENCIAKSTVRCAIQNTVESSGGYPIYYFPSYEIVLDELRSCDPYEGDFLHVNMPQTFHYVISRFIESCFSEDMVQQFVSMIRFEKLMHQADSYQGSPYYAQWIRSKIQVVILPHVLGTIRSAGLNERLFRNLIKVLLEIGMHEETMTLLQELDLGRHVVFWGIGSRYKLHYENFVNKYKYKYEFTLVDANRAGSSHDGFVIASPEQLSGMKINTLIVSSTFKNDIVQSCIELGLDIDRII